MAAKGSTKKSSKEPQTMEELLSMYGGTDFSHSVGDKVKGKIISIDSARVVVDIGGKSEGMVAEKAFKEAEDFIKTLKVGDEIEATVLVSETRDGFTILSFRRAAGDALWENIELVSENATPITVEGKGVTNSGVTVDVHGLTGFIPTSQLGHDAAQNPQSLIGKKFQAVIIDYDRDARKVILSEKEVSEKDELARARLAMKNVKEGEIFDGVVTTVYDFGCFVKIEVPVSKKNKEKVPLEGLVHVSELAWEKIADPNDVVKEGDKVKVKVVGKKNEKLAFSMKQTGKDPWDSVVERYEKDAKVKGKVMKLTDFGVFVQLEPGLEGLVHMTKIPPGKKLGRGDEVQVYVEDVDRENKRISLGLVLTEKPVGYR
ncbi:hypothetical protein A2715_06245 [Candidatus Woesebacteria bacterium RIFCSPHIGHO2_01_FULL_39_32]|uniref:S1 motif domain-containing protein n=2 Tax=Candidatus Woeseibacteriota TaxID=1752722 RepID=A0A1F8BQE5_9BACT|nr:MAG: hypothetical protein A2124_04665 [Candidatus Woesebacteria bacterium GWB1_37_5]OGM24564.1 MAG: hypothetical protein A2715_06245 [Candidatus Woesebacteria bacterium RIFCSPHIGHO2_01_FULL_39_32]OGM35300.1 MAG: hypothetical protein A3F01_01005 [Candidatus Woesebacteria bacterium RIFCSPHIGHO2_12_FULL_38_11]OGM65498.1 MAG: hypothetical protein A2893_01795 [Candidatus Woesebacteria bacterium RIFCSPLOWO2_01_FULL_39_25]